MFENDPLFEDRKKDHIRESLDKVNQVGISPSDEVFLEPRALPEIDFKDVSLKVCIFSDKYVEAPVFVSSMTAGHDTSEGINYRLAQACYRKNWALAVGSQRRELFSENQKNEWLKIRSDFPGLVLLGNIGLAQVIHTPMEEILKLIENLGASALFVHLNSLQEVLQAEGTPFFKGGLDKLQKISNESPVPILVKETGCGMSKVDLKNLFKISSLYAVDVSGFGGTHWGRIEGRRNLGTKFDRAAQVYKNWGLTTAQSLEYCEQLRFTMGVPLKYWASGGIRSGLDVVISLAMGAEMVGLAQPFLKHALKGSEALNLYMDQLEYETRVGMFCLGVSRVEDCRKEIKWHWKK